MTTLTLASIILLAQAKGAAVSFEDKVLSVIPEDVKAMDIVFSPDGKQVAYKGAKGLKVYICVNKEKSPDYDGIGDPVKFGATGKVAYRATPDSNTWVVVFGGQTLPPLAVIGPPVISPDGSKVAYAGSRGRGGPRDPGGWAVYVGGQKQGADFAACDIPTFSADGSIVAYSVRVAKAGDANRAMHTTQAMCIGGKAGTEYDWVGTPAFAPKGNKLCYQVRNTSICAMMVDGKPGENFTAMFSPTWSPDGTKLAYTGTNDARLQFVVIDGKKGEGYMQVGDPIWSSDSKHCAYKAKKGTDAFIVVDGKPLEPYPNVENPAFSPDGTQIAYGAMSGSKMMMVMGDKKFDASYTAVGKPVWAPDGSKVCYQATWKYKQIIAVNEGKSEVFDAIGKDGPLWSPNSKNFAMAAQKDGKWWCVVAYRRDEPFDEVLTGPNWSPDSKKCAFGVRKGQELIWRVVTVPDDQ